MSREEIYSRLKEIFADVFDDEDIEIKDETVSADIVGWDSLMHITLIGVIEDEFAIKFPMEALSKMKNISVMVDTIQELV